ncbi:hypothetical protein FB451DRAFT_1415476 [Mycena latifolia]|nr:hypothetical protein FB451DRAFT_1415476 [Mycena latifolia]
MEAVLGEAERWAEELAVAGDDDDERDSNGDASPQVYYDPEDSYRKECALTVVYSSKSCSLRPIPHRHAISAGCLALSFLTAFTLRTHLSMLNKRNAEYLAELPENEKKQLEEMTEIWDTDPRYVFMT